MIDDWKPFLQIVHISDLHVVDGQSPPATGVRNWIRRVKKIFTGLAGMIAEGVAPHDPLAVSLFKQFLKDITEDPDWKDCVTWVVDSGDLTSLGDQASLNLGAQHLGEFKQICPNFVSIYGNHDAWPGKLPAVAALVDIQAQPQKLSAMNYSVAAPTLALHMLIPHANGEVQLYTVDSVIHNIWDNTWARGEVEDLQIDQLKQLVDSNYSTGRHDFRILLVHHPVHYPPPRPYRQMIMKNDAHVAKVLDTTCKSGAYPIAHLVLSGHTHNLYPDHGVLPSEPLLCNHPNLGDPQCQFVVGSLMQLDKSNKRSRWPHQCEVLRLYYSDSDHSIISMDRLLAARQSGNNYRGAGIGPYLIVSLPQDLQKTAEEITFCT